MLGLPEYQVGRPHAEPAPPVQNWGRRSRGMQRTGRAREGHTSQRGFRRTGPLGSSKPSPPSSGHRLASQVIRLTPTRTFCQAQTHVLCSRPCHNRAHVGGVKGTMMPQATTNATGNKKAWVLADLRSSPCGLAPSELHLTSLKQSLLYLLAANPAACSRARRSSTRCGVD
jgi:hypothetical protein